MSSKRGKFFSYAIKISQSKVMLTNELCQDFDAKIMRDDLGLFTTQMRGSFVMKERFYAETTLEDFEQALKKYSDSVKTSDLLLNCEWENLTPIRDSVMELRGLCSVSGSGLDVIRVQVKQHDSDIEIIAECESDNSYVRYFFAELFKVLKKMWEVNPPTIAREVSDRFRRAFRPDTEAAEMMIQTHRRAAGIEDRAHSEPPVESTTPEQGGDEAGESDKPQTWDRWRNAKETGWEWEVWSGRTFTPRFFACHSLPCRPY